MAAGLESQLMVASAVGLAGGLTLLIRGLGGYRSAARISDTATSRISALAVGEVRLSGVVEPAELLLTSPLTSEPCVYYDAEAREQRGDSQTTVFRESRAVGFRLRDGSGEVRVFPGGAHWDVPRQFDGHTGFMGDPPPGLNIRSGAAVQSAEVDREVAIQRLLTAQEAPRSATDLVLLATSNRRSYREARVAPGDTITIVGFAEPFDQLPDPTGADDVAVDGTGEGPGMDPAVAADIAEARASGELAADPETAWGNAAIPGFGIGHPVRPPHLDDGAQALPLADAETASRIERTFTIAPETLIVAATEDVPLLISFGEPGVAAARQDGRFLLGLLGAVLAIVSAVALAALVTGGI